jgi:hypothetical protein
MVLRAGLVKAGREVVAGASGGFVSANAEKKPNISRNRIVSSLFIFDRIVPVTTL